MVYIVSDNKCVVLFDLKMVCENNAIKMDGRLGM